MSSRWWIGTTDNAKKEQTVNNSKRSPNSNNKDPAGRLWKFQVFVNFELNLHEKVAVTGSIEEFGNWKPNDCVFLNDQGNKIWTLEVSIPRDVEIEYRYFITSVDPSDENNVHVRKWETHLKPRIIPKDEEQAPNVVDHFGILDGVEKVDKGWLTHETILQFKFFNNPFSLKDRVKNRLLYVKLTPMNLRISAESSGVHVIAEESVESYGDSNTRENNDSIAYAFTEVATLNGKGDDYLFKQQEQFGRAYNPGDILTFHVTVCEPENIAYLIDLYYYKNGSSTDDPPHHLGYHYMLPNVLKKSEGALELVITCASKHRPLGLMKMEFVKITPLNNPRCDMRISWARYWNDKHKGLDVGHRGSGTSFKTTSGTGVIRENTIASLKQAGLSGAKWVEFDVQLSKDLHPVIYHDFHVYVSLKKKATLDTHDLLELPMRELTLEQLKNLKVYHTVEGKNREAKFFDENLEEHQPFPTLAEVLEAIDPNIGFNIEVKSAQQLEDGTVEADNGPVDKNLYVDCILDVVLKYAGNRRIVFSSFDTDICLMLRNKQNIYPTMFLTLGVTKRYKQYSNPCGNKIEHAVKFSAANELLGICAHSEDILRDINQVNQVKDEGLVIWTWGEDNNCKDTIKYLKSQGIHAIIYDKIDKLIDNEKDIFVVGSARSESAIYEQIGIETHGQH